MNITEATADSLGNKLAGLELTDEESVLLHVLLASQPDDDEVAGFGMKPGSGGRSIYDASSPYLKRVIGPLPSTSLIAQIDGFTVEIGGVDQGYIVTADLQDW